MSKGMITIEKAKQEMDGYQESLAMQGQLRQAIFNAITEADVTEIVKKQVQKAKEGDDKSLQFVMKYVLGFGQPVTIQNVTVMDTEGAARRQAAISRGD